MTNKMWGEVNRLSNVFGFAKFYQNVSEEIDEFQLIYDSPEPHRVDLPASIKDKFNSFEKLLILRCIRPDKLIPGIIDYIVSQLDSKFVEPPPFDLAKIY